MVVVIYFIILLLSFQYDNMCKEKAQIRMPVNSTELLAQEGGGELPMGKTT